MLFIETLLASGVANTPPIPSLGVVTVTSGRAGTCPADEAHAASVHVAWGLTNGGSPAYELRVLEDGALLATLGSGVSFYNKVLVGFVEGSTTPPKMTSNWTYTVQLVRVADGVVVQSAVSSAWIKSYGGC